jgi:hypothetical protein
MATKRESRTNKIMPSAVKSAAQKQLDIIGDLLSRLNKRAKEESDPGGFDGDTSHQTKDTDNSTVEPTEGSRSSENEQDIKHDQPVGVDQTAAGTPGGQDAAQVNIGTQQSGPDETPGNIPDVSDDLPDPGGYEGESSHQTADKPNTEKYGAARKLAAALPSVREAGTDLLAKIVMAGSRPSKKAEDAVLPAETVTGSDDAKPSSASLAGGSGGDSEKKDDEKEAAEGAKAAQMAIFAQQQRDSAVVQGLAETLKSAQDNAAVAAEYLNGFFAQLEKGADEDSGDDKKDKSGDKDKGHDDSDSSSSDSSDSSGDSGGSPFSGGSSGGDSSGGDSSGGGDPVSQLLGGGGGGGVSKDIGGSQAVGEMLGGGGGGGAPGGDPLGGGGGAPPMGGSPMGGGAPPAGGDPMGGSPMGGGGGGGMGAPPMGGSPMGGPPMGGGGGMGGGMGGGDPQQMAMLAEALAQLGITPEQLQQAAGAKTARARFQSKTGWAPKTQKEAEQFQRMREVVSELVS